ncbi:MAG TPA: AAA family ATPase [Jatrophihabitans sp.]|nr:AAA family ATPase [Jatrophihabitans sp.]
MTGTGRDTPLIGRSAELAQLAAALREAATGRATAVLLTGEAGVGKTRLVQALLADLAAHADAPVQVLRAQCVDLGEPGLPFLAVRDLVRAVRAVADELPAVASLLASLPPVTTLGEQSGAHVAELADDAARPQLLDAAATLLAGTARARPPALVVIEDAQWADASTADFLRFLLSRLTDEPVLVIVTVRTDSVGRRPQVRGLLSALSRLPVVTRLELRPFDADEVAQYLEVLLQRPVPGDVVADVTERTGGNAFYVQSVASGVGDGTHTPPLPDALADVLVARVDGLSPDARAVLRSAAVAGRAVPHPLLAAVTGFADDRLETTLREVVADRLLVAEGGDGYAFGHGLLREALVDDLLPSERTRLHRAYADALAAGVAGRAASAEVAHHMLAAGDRSAALTWSVRAADEAARVPAPSEALAHLDRSLALWETADDAAARAGTSAAELARRAARAAALAGEPNHAVDLARRAVELAEAPAVRVGAELELARTLIGLDLVDEAVEHAALGVQAALEGARPLEVAARSTFARALLAARRPDEARAQVELARAELADSGDPALDVELLTTLALLDEIDGDRAGAAAGLQRILRRAIASGELAAELRARYALACLNYYNGDVVGALPVLRDASERLSGSGLRWSSSGVELRVLHAIALYVAGDFAASLKAAEPGRLRPPDVAAARLAAVGCYAAVARDEHDVGHRFRTLREAWDLDPQVGLVAGGCEADHLTWAGEFDAAVEVAEQAQRHLDRTAGEGMYGGLWLCALALGALADRAAVARLRRDADAVADSLDRGAALVDRAHRIAGCGYGRPGALGPEGHAWLARTEAEYARLRGEPGVAEWERALEAFGYGYVYEQARCRRRLAEALLAAGDRDAARVHAGAALATAAELHAAPLHRAVEALINRSRLEPGAPGSAGPLTARELEVLTLVADGLTNRQIGQRLFISEKTASVHLSNLMAKLGVSGRTEAVIVAHRRGILDVAGT